jgi:hypothetical protein
MVGHKLRKLNQKVIKTNRTLFLQKWEDVTKDGRLKKVQSY